MKNIIYQKNILKKFLDNASQSVFDYAHPLKDLNNKLYGVKSDIQGYKIKGKEIDKLMYFLSAIFILYFALYGR